MSLTCLPNAKPENRGECRPTQISHRGENKLPSGARGILSGIRSSTHGSVSQKEDGGKVHLGMSHPKVTSRHRARGSGEAEPEGGLGEPRGTYSSGFHTWTRTVLPQMIDHIKYAWHRAMIVELVFLPLMTCRTRSPLMPYKAIDPRLIYGLPSLGLSPS
jgi:hypothetical protein